MSATPEGLDRLRHLVAQPYIKTVTTKSGIVKPKTKKQLEVEMAVAEEVVRFAFDHGGYGGEHLAPGGLWMELMAPPARPRCTCGARDFASCLCNISIRDYLAT